MEAIDEIVTEFLVESHENLDQLDRDLLALEQNPGSRELLASVFRTIHTIKGTSGFLAFHRLEKLSHVGENLLSRLRDGRIALTEDRATALLKMVDTIRVLLGSIERTGTEGDGDDSELISGLSSLLEDGASAAVAPSPEPATAVPAPFAEPTAAASAVEPAAETPQTANDAVPARPRRNSRRRAAKQPPAPARSGSRSGPAEPEPVQPEPVQPEPVQPEPVQPEPAAQPGPVVQAEPSSPAGPTTPSGPERATTSAPQTAEPVAGQVPVTKHPDTPPIGEVLVQAGATTPDAVEVARMEQGLGDSRPIGNILIDHGSATPAAVETALETQDVRRSVVESSVRVDVELLDSLMRLVGELVLARNQLVSRLDDTAGHTGDNAKDSSLARSAQRLSLVTSELQEQVMKTRMQPVDAVWSKMPRVVRDLARTCGRQVRLEMEGRETELDRSVLEAIKDPLTHLVRNAVDHGIEPAEVRGATGKPAEGVLRLRAYHEAGQVHLEIIDDGAGIDPRRIAAKALERGLVTQAQLTQMTLREIMHLIFLPGFSLAPEITNVSGRGVGMDVVKTRIEAIGGSVDVSSTVGIGSVFRLTIPLTLAIIPALTIGCAGRRYAVPQVSVLELVRLSGEHARGGIELISGAPVYRLRDMLLPLVRLDEQLGLVPIGAAEYDTPAAEGVGGVTGERGGFIVVLHAEQQRFGLVVDDVLDTQEIVVKPLGRHLKGIPVYAGATILGDGTVVLILDAVTLARRSNVLANVGGAAAEDTGGRVEAVEPVLVVEVAEGRRAAIPLEMVTRLEEIQPDSIERVGGREVVQYRGHIMPLVRLSSLLGAYGELSGDGGVQLVVYTRGDRSVGFVVERILDIATERVGTRSDIDDTALVGSVVVGDKVVELLDVESAVLAADPHFYSAGSQAGPQDGSEPYADTSFEEVLA
jgi:two-component system chemotaxis sensor kinase CheA